MLFRAVDIETVPDTTVWTPGATKWRAVPVVAGGRASSSCPPFTCQVVGSVENCVVHYESEELFPPPQAHRVVAVAWCDLVLDFDKAGLKTFDFAECCSLCEWGGGSERRILAAFREAMVARPATLVTWNGRTFDLPVMAMRAMHQGVPWGWYYDSRDVRYRYTDEGHTDLMDYLSDFGASRSMRLDDACRLVGLPGKAAGGPDALVGSKVESVVAQGELPANMARVGRYCLQDALQTALLFVRSRHHLEILDDAGYEASVATFRDAPAVRKAVEVDWERFADLRGERA